MRIAAAVALALLSQIAFGQGNTPNSPDAKADLLIVNAIGSKNPDIRKQAVVALGLVGAREPYLTQLETMASDPDVYVRLSVIASLLDLKHPKSIPVIQKAVQDDSPEVSFAASKALWSLNNDEGRKALLSVLSGESKTASSAFAARKRDTLRMFHTPRTLVVFAIRQGSGMTPIPGLGEGVSSLTDLLSDPGVTGRAATALLLSNDRSPEVLVALHDALRDKDASVRAAAVHALAVRGDPAERGTIAPLMDDTKENVRLRAAAGYIRLAWVQQNRDSVRQFMESQAAKERADKEKAEKNAAAKKSSAKKETTKK